MARHHGAPAPAEQTAYDKMLADQMASIDMKELSGELTEIKARMPGEQAAEEADYKSELTHYGPLDSLLYPLDKWPLDPLSRT